MPPDVERESRGPGFLSILRTIGRIVPENRAQLLGDIMPRRRRLNCSALASLLLASGVACTTAPRLSPSDAADRIRSEVSTDMTKADVRRIVGEPERREHTAPLFGDVSRKKSTAGNSPGECWLWGGDRLKPDAFVCFSGVDGMVSHKRP